MSDFRNFSAGYLANHMARLLEQALAEAIKPLGLTPGQFPTLLALWDQDARTQAELVREVDVEQATLALTLKRMERDGLIRREPNPKDSRSRLVLLTDKARALEQPALAAAAAVNARALAGIDDQEAELILEVMAKVITTLKTTPETQP